MDDTEQSRVSSAKSIDKSPKTVAAILLAAGRSERMGAFKPLLPFGKTTVIQSCINYLQAGGVETIVVVVGHGGDEVRQHLKHASVLFAVNPDPSSEMSESIRCGVEMLPSKASAALLALVDHPAVPPEVVTRLINEWMGGMKLVIPTWQGRGGHPVLVDLSYRKELQTLEPARGLKSLFQNNSQSVGRLEVASPYIARDMDTWDDYTRLYFDVFGQTPPAKNGNNESPRRAI